MRGRRLHLLLIGLGLLGLSAASCNFDYQNIDLFEAALDDTPPRMGGTSSGGSSRSVDNILVPTSQGGAGLGGRASTNEGNIIETLPDGFTPGMVDPAAGDPAPARGGYMRVGPLSDFRNFEQDDCANVLRGVTRDFDDAHPDFGELKAKGSGFVEFLLGEDRKPKHTLDDTIVTEIIALDDWFKNVTETNRPYVVDIWLEPVDDTFVFDTGLYFPLDGEGDDPTFHGYDQLPHNFHFTTELHTSFLYQGGETFHFRGDDDVWVYLNGRLAVDLGGVHTPRKASVDLDEMAETLNIQVGEIYNLDFYHAERRHQGSNFRIETTLHFTGCGELLPADVIR